MVNKKKESEEGATELTTFRLSSRGCANSPIRMNCSKSVIYETWIARPWLWKISGDTNRAQCVQNDVESGLCEGERERDLH